MDKPTMSRVKAIKTFFGSDGYPPVTTAELKSLSKSDREELGTLAAKELGVELEKPPTG